MQRSTGHTPGPRVTAAIERRPRGSVDERGVQESIRWYVTAAIERRPRGSVNGDYVSAERAEGHRRHRAAAPLKLCEHDDDLHWHDEVTAAIERRPRGSIDRRRPAGYPRAAVTAAIERRPRGSFVAALEEVASGTSPPPSSGGPVEASS